MNEKLKAESNLLANATVNHLKNILLTIDEYTKKINVKGSLFFSVTSKETEKMFEDYLRFAASIYNTVIELSATNAKLASLLIKTDKAMEIELTLSLESRLNAFIAFEAALYEYTSSVETAYDNEKLTVSILLNSAQKFKNAITELISANSQSVDLI